MDFGGFMVQRAVVLAIFVLVSLSAFATDNNIMGQEHIQPISFPKFIVFADRTMKHNLVNLDRQGMVSPMHDQWGGGLAFAVEIYRYFDAGAMVCLNAPGDFARGEPLKANFQILAMPKLPFGERAALFAKASAGIASVINGDAILYQESELGGGQDSIYKGQTYNKAAFGFAGSATLGGQAFLTSRLGLSLEAGIRSEIYFHLREGTIMAGSPVLRKYLMYGLVGTLNVLIIL